MVFFWLKNKNKKFFKKINQIKTKNPTAAFRNEINRAERTFGLNAMPLWTNSIFDPTRNSSILLNHSVSADDTNNDDHDDDELSGTESENEDESEEEEEEDSEGELDEADIDRAEDDDLVENFADV